MSSSSTASSLEASRPGRLQFPKGSRAHALRDAIVEFDPALHELPGGHERLAPEAAMPGAAADDDGYTGGTEGRSEGPKDDGV